MNFKTIPTKDNLNLFLKTKIYQEGQEGLFNATVVNYVMLDIFIVYLSCFKWTDDMFSCQINVDKTRHEMDTENVYSLDFQ